jgi:hypothetical protein
VLAAAPTQLADDIIRVVFVPRLQLIESRPNSPSEGKEHGHRVGFIARLLQRDERSMRILHLQQSPACKLSCGDRRHAESYM